MMAPGSSLTLGGKGLWLVNQLCDLVQARTSHAGTVARLHMRLGQPARQQQVAGAVVGSVLLT